jgi:sugar phosphate permease
MTFIRTRLSVMMFLEFLIWGAWYPLIFGYLPAIGFDNNQQTIALACFNVAAIVAMFFSTQFADRNFAAERFLAFSMLIGGIAMIALPFVPLGWVEPIPGSLARILGPKLDVSFCLFFLLMLLHCLFYVP